jgi:hypothetical protein
MVTIDQEILSAFDLIPVNIEPVTEGLINAGFKITTDDRIWFLQKINTQIFTSPATVQHNYELIAAELQHKKSFKLPSIKKTIAGEHYLQFHNESWRCFEFYDHCYSRSLITSEKDAYTIGSCFGKLTADLGGLDEEKIKITIPHFHDLHFRYSNFLKSIHHAKPERLQKTKNIIAGIQENNWPLKLYERMTMETENFGRHIMHHDCKLSNILFSRETGEVVCPVDMDTTMPGYFFSDLGDMIRSLGNNLDEDDADIQKMKLETGLIESVEKGYESAVSSFFTKEEIKFLPYSGHLLAFMQTLRFVTDYLQDDIYYKINYPEHNLHRSRNQWRLFELLSAWREAKRTF